MRESEAPYPPTLPFVRLAGPARRRRSPFPEACADLRALKRLRAEWDAQGRSSLRAIGQHRAYAPGDRLCEQGTYPIHVFLVESGTVALTLVGSEGGDHVVGVRSQGSTIGAACALHGEPLAFSASALSQVEVVELDTTAFIEAFAEIPAVSRYIAETLCRERLLDIHERQQFLSLTAAQRIEDLLWRLVMDSGPEKEIRLPFSRTFLASLLGVTRQHVSRVLNRLERRGVLYRSKNILVILKPHLLWHVDPEREKNRPQLT